MADDSLVLFCIKKALRHYMNKNDVNLLTIKKYNHFFKVFFENNVIKIEHDIDIPHLPKIVNETVLFDDPYSREANLIRGVLCHALGLFLNTDFALIIEKGKDIYAITTDENSSLSVSLVAAEEFDEELKDYMEIDIKKFRVRDKGFACCYNETL